MSFELLAVVFLGFTLVGCSAPYPNGGTVSVDREGEVTISMPVRGYPPAQQRSPTATLAIQITEAGYLLQERSTTRTELALAARQCAAEFGDDCHATLTSSPTTPRQLVVETIDLLRVEHVTRFAINVRPESLH